MKEWPKDPTTVVSYSDLIDPVRKTADFLLSISPKNKGKDAPYEGYNHTQLHITPPADQFFTVQGLKYDEERGRDALDRLFNLVFLLGFEQGRRDTLKELRVPTLKNRLESYAKELNNMEPKEVANLLGTSLVLEAELLGIVLREGE